MRIGYILTVFPKLSETFVTNEIVELIKRGHDIYIFSISYPGEKIVQPEITKYSLLKKSHYPPPFFKFAFEVQKLYSLFSRNNQKSRGNEYARKLYCRVVAKHFSKTIKKLNLDVLHAHFADDAAYVAMLISKINRMPFTFTAHAIDIFFNPNVRALKEISINAAAIITVSHYNKDYLHKLTGVGFDKIHVVRACISDRFKTIRTEPLRNAARILTVARLVEKKGIKYGIHAIKELQKEFPDIEYRVVGSGPLENELKVLVKSLSLDNNVKFLGNLDSHSLIKELCEATIFILPCIRTKNGDMDGVPVSLMESMYLRIPSISTNISGIPELIENGKTGFLIEEKNVKQLTEAIRTLLLNQDLRLEMGDEGRKKIRKEFNIQNEVGKLLKIWNNIRSLKER